MEADNNNSSLNNENNNPAINEEDEKSLFNTENNPSENIKSEQSQYEIPKPSTEAEDNLILDNEIENDSNQNLLLKSDKDIEAKQDDFNAVIQHDEKDNFNDNVSFKYEENYHNCFIVINKKVFENFRDDKSNIDLIRKKIHRNISKFKYSEYY